MRKWLLRLVYAGLVLAPIAGYANYQLGQCTVSCTGFASAVVATIHYAQIMLTDASGADVSDTTNHAIKVNVVAGGAGGGAVTQSGTWTVQPGNTANTTPWLFQGNVSNAADAVATGSISAPSLAYNMMYNGTTWDRLRGDTTNGIFVNVKNANANGQAPMANSSPVVVASNQSNLPVINGGSRYQAVAASQTATVLQSSAGATGDYLSHCVIYPASTSPGVVTVFDNTNTAANSAILFAGGATSTSNLTPISVPVGALSRNGSWQVTTGANVSVVCYGKFS